MVDGGASLAEGGVRALRRRAWRILDSVPSPDRVEQWFDGFILSLIFLNVLAGMLGTVAAVQQHYGPWLDAFELGSVLVFSVEYLARLWACVEDPRFRRALAGRLRFALRPMSLVDLCAVLPFYLAFIDADLLVLRALRLFRVLRVARLSRYSASFRLFGRVFRNKREELTITAMVLVVIVVIASSLMYYAEHAAQPDKFADIPSTMWWSVVTLTTVGYGDVYPITALGRLLAAIIAIFGVGLFALPAGILAVSFVEELRQPQAPPAAGPRCCPHCGHDLPS